MSALLTQFTTGMATLRGGGLMLVPLLFLSLAATAIVLDRLAVLRREQRIPADIITRVYRLLERRKYDMAIALCESRPLLVMELLGYGVTRRDAAATTLAHQIRGHLRRRSAILYRNLFMLGLVAAVAPLLGLLGTVTGMIRAFDALFSRGGADQLRIVADGISVALLTTFAGLVVALPTYIAYRYLVHRSDQLVRQLQRYGISLVRFLQAEEIYHPAAASPGDDTDLQDLDRQFEVDAPTSQS
jgi:biopolymer transport protein ExbB